MKQPDFTQFHQNHNYPAQTDVESSIHFTQVGQERSSQTTIRKKSHAAKKSIKVIDNDQLKKIKCYTNIIEFQISIQLLNLLRNPLIDDHQFNENYLIQIEQNLHNIVGKVHNQTYREYCLYIHLILCQVENLDELQEELNLRKEILPINQDAWNSTNVMNTYCILANLKNINHSQPGQTNHKLNNMNENLSRFTISIIEQDNICLVVQNQLKLSKNLVSIALNSHGHWDIYFAPFLLQKIQSAASYRYLYFQQNDEQMYKNYSKIFSQLANEYTASIHSFSQNWYENQLQKLINDQFSINQIQQLVYSGVKNQDLQKLLIGLLGWKDNSDKAVKLLNCYYDSNDWQSNDATKPTICQCGENFTINYLIENSKNRDKIIVCLKAPCFNSNYNHYCFSFHKPKLNQYNADNVSYLWVQNPFGKFKKSGFYDWILYFANPNGKQRVNKIIDIRQNKKVGSQFFNKNVLNMKNVKGRYIIHPQNSRQMQIHQVYIDSLSSDEGLYKTPLFTDVIKQLQVLKANGINSVYISGIFQRDNGQFPQGFKRPQASSTALTNRTTPSSLLGGQKSFIKLLSCVKSLNLKLIIDCTCRVSSSHMSKKYQSLKLMFIDDKGRKNYFYGSEGRAVNYQESTVLNYRRKDAWDLIKDQIIYLIQHYKVDGIYLDNGSVTPQIFQIDKEEFARMEDGKLIYTHQQTFQGHIINPKKKTGYWSSKASNNYPNPFFLYLTQNIWNRYPNFTFICETYETQNSLRYIKAIQSGFIPRLFKLPKALSQVVGIHLHENGSLSQTPKKSVTKLAKWYEQTKRILPKNSIIIQSTTNHIYPYPSLIFKKATWAVIDIFFFLPEIPMTFSKQHLGRAYRTKALNMYVDNDSSQSKLEQHQANMMKKTTSYSMVNSTFFSQEIQVKKKQKTSFFSNTTIREPSQIRHLQQNFRKQVGPQFGFDLAQIHKHYQHRRQLRAKLPLLTSYRMIPLSSEHLYGIHTNVISFAKYDQKQILLISINFNEADVDMHYNLTPLKWLFKNSHRSNLIIKLQDVLNPKKFVQQYYSINQLLNSKIQQHLKAYSSSIWQLSILPYTQDLMKQAFKCSQKRIAQHISRNPPQWIYSSIFTNQLSRLIGESKTLKPFVNGLNTLYNQFLLPMKLNFNLVISKTHQLFVHKVKLEKLFGIFKLLQRVQNKPHFQLFQPTLRNYIENLLKGNQLGPIAFVTPQIGIWSSVGGLGVMVDELSKQLVKLGQTVYIITPYYEYNKKKQTNYLAKDNFIYERNVKVHASHFQHQFGIHRGTYFGVNYIWLHNPQLFSRPYDGQGAMFVTKQMVFFALVCLQSFCQLKIFPSIIVTNDWMCGFVSAYVKVNKYKEVFNGSKFIHICHNLDPLYQGRLYPKFQEGDLNWLIQLPREWYLEFRNNKMVINPSRCALETCDNWGTVSHSYKIDLLKQSPLAQVLWKHPHPFSFPNGVRKDQRMSIIHSKTPGSHTQCKKMLQKKYFGFESLRDDMPLFAFIGRVTKQKGVHLILDAVESLLYQTQFKIQFLIGGPSDSKQQYGKYCAQRMKYLSQKYPQCIWSNPDLFFTDGALVNVGSDFSLMPSLFQPGGIVQHEFFCGSTPVIAFRTGGLKDTVFQFDTKTKKGNGFNFMSYQVQDFKRCMRRAINCYKNKDDYAKIRENAFQSVVQEEDVARGWNGQFYRMQNKIYIDWDKVQKQIQSFTQAKTQHNQEQVEVLTFQKGQYWKKAEQTKNGFKQVLKGASRLQVKSRDFCFQSDRIPRPKQVMITGTWDDWKNPTKMNFQKIHKNWKITLKLKPGTYYYKYKIEGEWTLNKDQDIEIDVNNIQNHVVIIQ